MNPTRILILGGNGQLGQCLQKAERHVSQNIETRYTSSAEVDVCDTSQIEAIFDDFKPHICINATAYTAVDLAETETEKAFAINAEAVGHIAEICKTYHTELIHISTDYVFDGESKISYDEDNFTNPQSVYGASKLAGEQLALENNPKTHVIRTSWLYSEFNKNFVKTMLMLFESKPELNVVADQYGQPTNANHLAEAIFSIALSPKKHYGIYHFSNEGETTWCDFASKIAQLSGSKIKIKPIPTSAYPTPAKRPMRSSMCLDKIEKNYGISLIHWEHALVDCLQDLGK
jgi:dTDP-4-dehydrorhamnose reductase